MKLKAKADKIAMGAIDYWEDAGLALDEATIREACDGATGGELSTSMLDRLCGMVAARLADPAWVDRLCEARDRRLAATSATGWVKFSRWN